MKEREEMRVEEEEEGGEVEEKVEEEAGLAVCVAGRR